MCRDRVWLAVATIHTPQMLYSGCCTAFDCYFLGLINNVPNFLWQFVIIFRHLINATPSNGGPRKNGVLFGNARHRRRTDIEVLRVFVSFLCFVFVSSFFFLVIRYFIYYINANELISTALRAHTPNQPARPANEPTMQRRNTRMSHNYYGVLLK